MPGFSYEVFTSEWLRNMGQETTRRHLLDATVLVSGTTAIPALLRDHGVDPAEVLTRARLSPALFDDPGNVIPLASLLRLLQRCAARTGCPHFGLLVGQRGGLHSIGLVGLVARHSTDVETALRKLVSYMRLHNSGAVMACTTIGGTTMLTYDIQQLRTASPDQFYDGVLASIHNILRTLCGPGWAPTEVHFAHLRPANVQPFRRHFGAPLHFDARQNAIVFPARWLKHRLPEVDPELDRLLRNQIDALAARQNDTFPEQVRRVLQTGLLTGHAGADQVASLFAMHRRTLARRLDAFDASFKNLVDEGRFELAQRMLLNTSMQVCEIAEALDYADASAFTRAFRRWSGTTPAAWRASSRAHGVGGSHSARSPPVQ